MTLPHILVIDDQYPNDTGARQTFLKSTSLFDIEQGENGTSNPLATATFCSGQRRTAKEIVNDYETIRRAVKEGPADGGTWALVLLDVCFDSGPLDAFGLPDPQPGDDTFGEEVRRRLAADFPGLPVVMLTSKKESELSDRSSPYLSKTGLTPHEIAVCLLHYGRLTPEQQRRLLALPDGVVARDPASFAVFREAFRVAGSDASVLILGETGTGKEVLARYIHQRSHRAGGPFVPVNVAAVPAELVESILFGHERGAFTGADRKQEGLFVKADGGTLFLDEIGDMPAALQTKVLRALHDGEVLPVGAAEPVRVDVRVVSATSRDLAAMQQEGRFREDLVRRISDETLVLSPLRERRGEIVPLAGYFLEQGMREAGKQGMELADDAGEILRRHPFAGNVAELRQVVRSLVSRKSNNSIITADDVQQALAASFVSTGAPLSSPPATATGTVAVAQATGTLDRLVELLESWPVSPDDPFLEGGKPRLEDAVRRLRRRMAGAALERFRDPRNGRLNRQAAMQWLTGDSSLKGKGPGRVINEILGRRADAPIREDDLEELAKGRRQSND